MIHLPSGALTLALSSCLLLGAAPARAATAEGAGAARAPIVLARTSCDENGRCYETGDPDRNESDEDRYDGRRRLDQDDDAPRRRFDEPDDRGPPRDFDRRPPPRDDYRGNRRPDDDDE